MGALQQHQFEGAAAQFRRLIATFPAERAFVERARVYLELCDRELRRTTGSPDTREERLTAATAALNDDRDADAERLARSVLDEQPEQDLALYLLAAIHARRGQADAAVQWLERAIRVSPDIRAQAVHDADFDALRDRMDFRSLVESHASAQSGAIHERKSVSER